MFLDMFVDGDPAGAVMNGIWRRQSPVCPFAGFNNGVSCRYLARFPL
jgi:hypothetical protein